MASPGVDVTVERGEPRPFIDSLRGVLGELSPDELAPLGAAAVAMVQEHMMTDRPLEFRFTRYLTELREQEGFDEQQDRAFARGVGDAISLGRTRVNLDAPTSVYAPEVQGIVGAMHAGEVLQRGVSPEEDALLGSLQGTMEQLADEQLQAFRSGALGVLGAVRKAMEYTARGEQQ